MKPIVRALTLITLLSPLSASAIRPHCQVEGHVKDAKGKSIAVIGAEKGKTIEIAKAEPDKDGHYQIEFGWSDRLSFEKIRVRLLDAKGNTLKELDLPKPDERKVCANTIDF